MVLETQRAGFPATVYTREPLERNQRPPRGSRRSLAAEAATIERKSFLDRQLRPVDLDPRRRRRGRRARTLKGGAERECVRAKVDLGFVEGVVGVARAVALVDQDRLFLEGQRQRNWRVWRQLARAPRGEDGAPSGWASLWECRAAQSRQARAEEAQEASWGIAKGVITR